MKSWVTTVLCLGVGRLLAAGVVYVAPTLPEGSDDTGSSWANATTNLSAACLAASQMSDGGEVWVKKGYYNIAVAIPIYSNVKVIGGFAGGETSAEAADPEANHTVIGCLTHRNGTAKYTPKWVRCRMSDNARIETSTYEVMDRTTWAINLPPDSWYRDYDRTESYIATTTAGQDSAFSDTAGGVSGAVFRGLIFYGYHQSSGYAIQFGKSGNESSVEIDTCTFVSCNKGVLCTKGTLTLANCQFIGCTRPFYTEGSATAANRGTVDGCSFLYCTSGTGNAEADIFFAWRAGTGDISNCTFRRNWDVSSMGWLFCMLGSGTFTDTVFEENIVACSKGNCIVYGGWSYARCRFRNNEIKAFDSTTTWHATVVFYSGGFVKDTTFEGNRVSGSRASSASNTQLWTPCVATAGGAAGILRLINCSFLTNVNAVANSDTDHSATVLAPPISGNGEGKSYGVSIINCLFSENRAPADLWARGSDEANEKNAPVIAINTVFHSTAADYQPFNLTSLVSPGLANCNISRWEEIKGTVPTGNNGYLYSITSDDPFVLPIVKHGTNNAYAVGLSAKSPFRKTGRGVWQSTDGRYWFYDDILTGHDWRWRNLADKTITASVGAYRTSSPPPGIEADFSTPLIPNAFGEERQLGKVSLGPLNAPSMGFVMVFQ